MILLSNSLTTPAIGTLFWTVVIFTMFFLILTKFAWKPILNMVKQREEMIKGSLASAEKARKEMVKLQSDNEAILKNAPRAIAPRIGNAYGAGDAEGRLIPELISRIRAGGTQPIRNERRSFIHLDDIAEALLRAAVAAGSGLPAADRAITVAHPRVHSTLQAAEMIKARLGAGTRLVPSEGVINQFLELDLSRMRRVLGLEESDLVPLDEGLRKTLAAGEE